MGGIPDLATFVFFGPAHVTTLALTAAAALGLSAWARKAKSERPGRAIAWALAAVLVIDEAAGLIVAAGHSDARTFCRGGLPLHICDAALFATVIALVARSGFFFEIAWFWGLGGTLQGLLTPNLDAGFPEFDFLRFVILHGGIVASALFMALGLRMRPRRGAVLRLILATNVWLAFLAVVDLLLGANYGFLCQAPPRSPLFFLPWPWYLLLLEAAGVLIVVLLYLPFYPGNRASAGTPPPPEGRAV